MIKGVNLEDMLTKLRPIVAKLLKISDAELLDNEPLVNYGVSSLTALILLHKINKIFNIVLPMEQISMNHNLMDLSKLIVNKLNEVEKMGSSIT